MAIIRVGVGGSFDEKIAQLETMEKLLPQRVPDDAGFPPLTGKRQFVPPANMLAEPKE